MEKISLIRTSSWAGARAYLHLEEIDREIHSPNNYFKIIRGEPKDSRLPNKSVIDYPGEPLIHAKAAGVYGAFCEAIDVLVDRFPLLASSESASSSQSTFKLSATISALYVAPLYVSTIRNVSNLSSEVPQASQLS